MKYNIVVAHSYPNYGIGKDNKLCWSLPNDMNIFKKLTMSTCPSDITDAENHYKYENKELQMINDDKSIHYVNVCIMGRKTWDSIPEKFKPLKDRLNIVITNSNVNSTNTNLIYCTWKELKYKIQDFNSKQIKFNNKIVQTYRNFIIGGETIYKLALDELNIESIYITEVYTPKGEVFDTYFTDISNDKRFTLISCSKFQKTNNLHHRFMKYINAKERREEIDFFEKSDNDIINKEELIYLENMQDILESGIERSDRTNVGTISKFGLQMKYDLRDTFPLSTTKKMFFRAIVEELLLYLRGQTDNNILTDKNIHIWDGNTSRDFLDKRGLNDLPEGDMGSTYGFNFRHFGGEYINCKTDHKELYSTNQTLEPAEVERRLGYDQLVDAIKLIREDPTSRRIIINLWNPMTNKRAALPSCLCMYQFYVDTEHNELSLQIYIRSSDYFLANNWNTCTGALLVHMICGLDGINLVPGELTVVVGDAHLYKTHIEQVRENLSRKPYPFPKLSLEPNNPTSEQIESEWKSNKKTNHKIERNYVDDDFNRGKIMNGKRTNLTDYRFEDFKLIGYKAHPRISAEMAV